MAFVSSLWVERVASRFAGMCLHGGGAVITVMVIVMRMARSDCYDGADAAATATAAATAAAAVVVVVVAGGWC